MITTPNLQLIICEQKHIEAFLRGKSELAALLGVTIPDSWPTFPEAFSLPIGDTDSPAHEWWVYLFIHPQMKMLIGNGGFKGAPDDSGTVEIGYEIASEYWNRGYGTEAARGLIDFAFSHDAVQTVIAHTLAEKNASNTLLQKVGMKFAGELSDPDEGKIWRWQISREEYINQ